VQLQALSTKGILSRREIESWDDIAASDSSLLRPEPENLAHFADQLASSTRSPLPIAEVYSDARVVRHTSQHIGRALRKLHFLHLQLEGESTVRQDQREAHLAPGDITILDNCRPFEIAFERPNRMLVFGFDDQLLRRYIQYPQSITAIHLSGNSGMGGLLSDFLKNVWQHSLRDKDFDVNAAVTDTMLGLVANAYRQSAGATIDHNSIGAAHRVRIVNYIEEKLADPLLTPTRIAAAFRITTRYLHHLFSDGDETVARLILRRRLEECARALASSSQRSRTITSIAFDHGFSSATHFGRVFRSRYGVTPREYRSRNSAAA